MTHSGRQFGGAPSIPCKQEHTGLLSITLHSALAPQGDGTHGLVGTIPFSVKKKVSKLKERFS